MRSLWFHPAARAQDLAARQGFPSGWTYSPAQGRG